MQPKEIKKQVPDSDC
jgi:WD40 repeat protein